MKRFISFIILMVTFTFASTSFADGSCHHNALTDCGDTINDNSVTNKGGNGGAGGDADAAAYAQSIGVNWNSLSQSQQQSMRAYVTSINKQGQAQFGSVENNGPQVAIKSEYKAAASSAVGPGVETSQVTVTCPLFVQGGISAGGSAVAGSGSLGFTDTDAVPACFALLAARNTAADASNYALWAFYCLSMEAANVESAFCGDWRRHVAMGADYRPAAITAGDYTDAPAPVRD